MMMMSKQHPRDHRGYYREDDDLTVADGAIQRNKDWSTYRKTDTFIVICAAIVLASIIGGGIAIGVHFATGGSARGGAGHGSVAHIVPRFPVMQLNAVHPNGTHYGINSTISGISSTDILATCSENAEETMIVTKFTNQTTADATTTVKMTRTQTLHQSAQGTTVSSAKAANATMSGSFTVTKFVPVVTQVITTSVTETAYRTATATESQVVPESKSSSSSSKASTVASTSEAASHAESSSADATSVVLTKTLIATRKITSTVQEVVSTTTYTPTTVIRHTVTVTSQPLVSPPHEAQCSREVQNHTVYVTVTQTATLGGSVPSSTAPETVKMSSSPVCASKATDTVVVTYTVTVDSMTPISEVSSDAFKHSTKVFSHSEATRVVTQVATQTVYVTVADGTTVAFSTAVSSVLGHAGTPVVTSPSSTETAEASAATDVVVVTKTVTDQVFRTLSASSTSSVDVETHVETDTRTSVVTVTALPGTSSESSQSSKSIFTTVVLTDRGTKTVTVGGMTTVTVHPKKPASSVSAPGSARTDTKFVTEVGIRTLTVTLSGHVQTSLVTVHKNLTATVTQTKAQNTTVSILTDVFRLPLVNTTVYISGTPMMHPRPTTAGAPPFPVTNHTVFRPATTFFNPSDGVSVSPSLITTTVVVVSNAEKRAEPVMFGFDAATGGCKSCTTCLVIFVMGLLVLF